ncbi:MAG: glycogen debranching N-terminal domain-containing protein, partial [Ilumatobacteraceae bacterium]
MVSYPARMVPHSGFRRKYPFGWCYRGPSRDEQNRIIVVPLDVHADTVPAVGGGDALTVLDGSAFAISDRRGDIRGGVHGFVHADRRHLSRFVVSIDGRPMAPIASATPAPNEAIVVHRLRDVSANEASAIVVRRRTIGGGLREHLELWATGAHLVSVRITVDVSADFAHIFDVKAGRSGPAAQSRADSEGVCLIAPRVDAQTRVRWDRAPDTIDGESMTWELVAQPHARSSIVLLVEPLADGATAAGVDVRDPHASPVAIRDLDRWKQERPGVTSTDARLVLGVEQAFADLAALQIRDVAHPERVLVAAGAPWFMTLFGRDALLTTWMTLPFDASLAAGVLLTLGELRGRRYEPMSEEEPGKILHEVRHGSDGGPFSQRGRYYGSI